MHVGLRVTKASADLGGGELLHEVRPQRLIPSLHRLRGLGEVRAARPHTSGDLSELHTESVEALPDGKQRGASEMMRQSLETRDFGHHHRARHIPDRETMPQPSATVQAILLRPSPKTRPTTHH